MNADTVQELYLKTCDGKLIYNFGVLISLNLESILKNLAVLMEEVGELSRLFARVYGEQSFKDSDRKGSNEEMLADEMKSVYSGISQGNAGVSRAAGANYALVADVNS